MVKELHAAGIEVILDVVYNHTAEGDHTGPTLSFKGIDNPGYYRLDGGNRARYTDYTGCGNTLDVRRPAVLALLMDSLRYWVTEMHVDGFRFDLASALARSMHDVDRLSAFFDVVHQDPVVSKVKLIAEPWDVGPGGYQVGNFPPPWTEWNGKYRDTVRDVWSGAHVGVRDLAYRLTGSSDLYRSDGRRPFASINFVTAHDGFTMADLVTYEHKRNEANGEDNRDGESHNRNWNCGVEGPTDDPEVLALRARQVRNLLTTLLLSTGVPMLTAGDELGRTQQGNNNAYCQDNEISWLDWKDVDEDLRAFVARLVALRRSSPVLRQEAFFEGHEIARHRRHPRPGLVRPRRRAADDAATGSTPACRPSACTSTAAASGTATSTAGRSSTTPTWCSCTPARRRSPSQLPGPPWADGYELVVSTEYPTGAPPETTIVAPGPVELPGRCVWLLRVLAPEAVPRHEATATLTARVPELGTRASAHVPGARAQSGGLLEGDDGPAEEQPVAVGERVGDTGLELGPLGGLGAGDVRAVERPEVDQRHLAARRAAGRRAPRTARSGCRRSAPAGRRRW